MGERPRSVESLVVIESSFFTRPDYEFWQGRRVLVTGHTGFKGSWLSLWLSRLGAQVFGISLSPETKPNMFTAAAIGSLVESRIVDIRDRDATHATVLQADPEVVFHLAAQPLVLESYRNPVDTFSTNVIGALHVLEAVRSVRNTKVVVMITTDKVYANQESVYPYREDDRLGGHDPYSASKAASEIGIVSYRESFLRQMGVAIATARAGNVIGGGDWSRDRLIPDIVRAWEAGEIVQIRRPSSVRPWQHVLEPLCGYLILAERLWQNPNLAEAYNFGPNSEEMASVRSVVGIAQQIYPGGQAAFSEDDSGPHEAGLLSLEIAKARSSLGVVPQWRLKEAVARTLEWYKSFYKGSAACELCEGDISAYEGR
jgi:CDP-glucose 4,6-dehydratase